MPYGDDEVCELPPNGQGVAALQALGLCDGLDLAGASPLDRVHLQAEAMKLAFADAYRYVSHDPLPAGYLDAATWRERRARDRPGAGGAPRAGALAARRHRLPLRRRRAAPRLLAHPERLLRLRDRAWARPAPA